MTFDPLDLFSAPEPQSHGHSIYENNGLRNLLKSENLDLFSAQQPNLVNTEDHKLMNDERVINADSIDARDAPLHVHDLPLLQLKPTASVLFLFLNLFAPDQVLNFSPLEPETDPETVFEQKNVKTYIEDALLWLRRCSSRFVSRELLACVSYLAETLRKGSMSEYNSWLTQVISSELRWIENEDAEVIKHLAALRLAENCGRAAHPEILRVIEVPNLERALLLKEPSLTSDNLGLKTWGSSFLLGSRLANPTQNSHLLQSPVLELGSGTGLVGMISSVLGYNTTLTDLPEIVPNLRDNLELNGISGIDATVDELDWLNPSYFVQKHPSQKYNTIILSDPLYSPKHPQWIVNMINLFLSKETTSRVLLQVPIRRNFENERVSLWTLMTENGYEVVEEDIELGHDDFGQSEFIFKKYVRERNQ